MDKIFIAIFLITLFLMGFAVGRGTSYDYQRDPTPEECLSICVDDFERMSC